MSRSRRALLVRPLPPAEQPLLVVGAGTAGIPAALAAADAGAAVVLIDKNDFVGGMLHVSGAAFSGAGTRRQRARNIEDSPEQHAAEVLRLAHGRGNEQLIRRSVSVQGEMVDWLEDIGLDFDPATPNLALYHEVYSVPRTYNGVDNGRSIIRVFARELDKRVGSGAIDLRLGTRVVGLVANEDGAIDGVKTVSVSNPDTEPRVVRGRGVVLASGGFAANRGLLSRFLPPAYHSVIVGCLPHASGDGLLMAEAVGASTTHTGYYMPTLGLVPNPEAPGMAMSWLELRINMVPGVRVPPEIWVNRAGERFVAEDTLSPEAIERALRSQPDMRMAIIFNERILVDAPPLVGGGRPWPAERVREEAARGKVLKTASDLEALARCLEVDPVGLARTVASYNQAVRDQVDPAFGRLHLQLTIEEPPYYGVIVQGGMLSSRDGLRVDADLRVLDRSDRPIPGLYAVGEVLGSNQLMGDTAVSGMMTGPAMALGRLLGRTLARL
jgi:fumarate reductase flavoprotein subunit